MHTPESYLHCPTEALAHNLFVSLALRRSAPALVSELRRLGSYPSDPWNRHAMAVALWFEVGRKRWTVQRQEERV